MSHMYRNLSKAIYQYDIAASSLNQLHDYTYLSPKQDGLCYGGFYSDKHGDTWLIKSAQMWEYDTIVNELVGGRLYQELIGKNAPKITLIYDAEKNNTLVGSKILDNFSTVNQFCAKHHLQYQQIFNYSINNKPIENFSKVLTSVIFLGDSDAHRSNVGIIEYDDHYEFAKIDHSKALDDSYFNNGCIDLYSFKSYTQFYFKFSDLDNKIGFDDFYQSIKNIVDLELDSIADLVYQELNYAKPYCEISHLNINLENYGQNKLAFLQANQNYFKDILFDLDVDKAVFDNDVIKMQQLLTSGIDIHHEIVPFFYNSNYKVLDGCYRYTPIQLAELYGSDDVKQLLTSPSNKEIIEISDILATNIDNVCYDCLSAETIITHQSQLNMPQTDLEWF